MKLLTLLLVPAALLCGSSRFARLGEFQGPVEVQLTAADPWIPAERNLPLMELAWVRTGAGARVEIEMDDGSAWRLGPDSLGEISDYTRLSTGQRITLLSLDHGTAYYTGQPASKDVTMLVMPGAQMTVLQGSRIRQIAQSGGSEAAVLEGLVRLSSPSAEMDIREGTTAHVDPANAARFSLNPAVAAAPLDRWSEDRDKVQSSPASAAYVNAAYGLADLDSAGKWVPSDSLGTVWKPAVADGWAPYRKGRWRYFDSVGYTWVSDDSWGWLPYHNGRWAREENLGWVWQPSPNPVFHPAEVYWLRGADFAGWGPLAPSEDWTVANPGTVTPQGYTSGLTTYASFRPDTRTVDGAGFDTPTAEQMKTAFFVPAPPSPAFLPARLDATRPMLQVGSTRIMPSVPGVTFGDAPAAEPPSDVMTNPPNDPLPPPPPPPDGVYPIPPVASVSIDAQIPIGPPPPDHPTYSPRRPASGSQSGSGQPSQTSNPPAPGQTSSSTGSSSTGAKPNPVNSSPSAPPASGPVGHPVGEPIQQHPIAPPIAPPKVDGTVTDPAKKSALTVPGEQNYYRQVLQDIDPKAPDFKKALIDLNAWAEKYPNSSSQNDRLYYYIHVYNGMARAGQVLDTAAPLVEAGVRASYRDQQQVLQILVAASASVAKVPKPTAKQLATGQKAARELLEFLPNYFAPRRKPAEVSDSAWSIARRQLEDVAEQALAHHPATRTASAN
jgi:hypothetical protein